MSCTHREQGNIYLEHGRSSPMITASLQRMQHANACLQQAFRLCHSDCLLQPPLPVQTSDLLTPVRRYEQQTVRQSQPLSRSCRCLCTASEETAAGGRRLFCTAKVIALSVMAIWWASYMSSAAHWELDQALSYAAVCNRCTVALNVDSCNRRKCRPSEQGAIHGNTLTGATLQVSCVSIAQLPSPACYKKPCEQCALRTSCTLAQQRGSRQCCLCKVRDITTKPEWWDAYSLTIPVLTVAREDGSEVMALLAQARPITANLCGSNFTSATIASAILLSMLLCKA